MNLSCPYCGTSSFVPDSLALGVARELRCQQCRTELALAYQTGADVPTRVELFDGRYEKLGPPTDSGQGVVYPAYDRTRRTVVAIRELTDLAALPRFERELELAKVLTHENIVVIYDHGQHRDIRYLTMEYLEGASLDRLLRSAEIRYERALDLLIMACQGLEYVHVRGVVHGALEPASMFVTSDDVLKLMNFGSATSVSDEPRAPDASAVGARGYTAPEQASSPSPVTPRADVWSLGALAYRLFTGVLPYPDFDEREAAREGRLPAAPSALNPRVPAELDAVILRALAGRPEDRPADAGELCERLMALRRKHAAQPAATAPITSVRPIFARAPESALRRAPGSGLRPARKLMLAGLAASALLGAGALLLRGREAEHATRGAPLVPGAVVPTREPASAPRVAAVAANAPHVQQAPLSARPAPQTEPAALDSPSSVPAASGPRTRLSAPRCPGGVVPVPARELQLAQPRPRAWTFAERVLPALPLDGFCIDPRPVSVAAYARCVEEGSCAPHAAQCSPSSQPDAPMKCVSWQAAQQYCAARGGELPSVAQWEAYAQTAGARTASAEWAKDAFPPTVFAARCAEQNPARCDGHLWRKAGRVPIVDPDGKGELAFSWNRGAATSASGYDYVSFRCVVPAPAR